MKAAEDRLGDKLTEALDWARSWHILAQRQMRSEPVVVGNMAREDLTQVFAQDHDVIRTLPAYRADQPLCMTILPG
jgi:hypothetical protein